MAQLKLTADILAAALIGFEVQKFAVDNKISEIRRLLGGDRDATAPTEVAKPRKKRSAAVRRKMRIAQQLRWKKIKQRNAEPPRAGVARPKRKVSRAARKKMALAQKARWAKVKKESEPQPTEVKRGTVKR